jgi:glutamate carboxypeptidase
VAATSPSDVLAWCRAETAWVRDLLETLVALESPSHDRTAVNRCGAQLAVRIGALGARVTRIDGGQRGDHIRADFDGVGRPVLLLGHFDTVWPCGELARMPLHEEDGRLYGPGIFDMKAGIAVSLLAMRALATFNQRPALSERSESNGLAQSERSESSAPAVTMLWTTDEEIGSETSRRIIEDVARQSRAVLVLEPSLPGGAAKTSRKGVGSFELVVHGIAAHAGLDPEKGASAIHELARQIVALDALQDLDRGITLNAGIIDGGSRTNVIADRAHASIDVRVTTLADAAAVEGKLRALQPSRSDVRLEVSGGVDRPPLERTPAVVRLYEQARAAARALGGDLSEGAAGGGSDGNFTAALGVPTLDGLGPRGDGAHARHEHVQLEDLPWRAAMLAVLLGQIDG